MGDGKGGGGGTPPGLDRLYNQYADISEAFAPSTMSYAPIAQQWADWSAQYLGLPAPSQAFQTGGVKDLQDQLAGLQEDYRGLSGAIGPGSVRRGQIGDEIEGLQSQIANWQYSDIGGGVNGGSQRLELEDIPAFRDLLMTEGSPQMQQMAEQYGQGRENIISSLPEGGAMQEQLGQSFMGEAQNRFNMDYNARTGAANMLLSGGPMSGYSQTQLGQVPQMAGQWGQQSMMANQMGAQAKGGLGQGMGQLALAASMFGK